MFLDWLPALLETASWGSHERIQRTWALAASDRLSDHRAAVRGVLVGDLGACMIEAALLTALIQKLRGKRVMWMKRRPG